MIQNHGYIVRGLLPPDAPQLFTEDFDQAKRYVSRQFIRLAERMIDAQNYRMAQQCLVAARSALSLRPIEPAMRTHPYWRKISTESVAVTISEVVGDAARTG